MGGTDRHGKKKTKINRKMNTDGGNSNDDNKADGADDNGSKNGAEDGKGLLEPPPRKRARMLSETIEDVATTDAPNEKTKSDVATTITAAASGTQQQQLQFEEVSKTSAGTVATKPSSRERQQVKAVPILHNVVACLSGLSPERKQHYHTLVEKLGGRYVQNWSPEEIGAKNCFYILCVCVCGGIESAALIRIEEVNSPVLKK